MAGLLAHARQGDDAALSHLFTACRSFLLLLAQSRLHGRAAARETPSDLVQQTLLDAYRDFAGFRGGTSAEWLGWLRQILDRNAADLARRHAAGKRDAGKDVPLPAMLAAGETPSACLIRAEDGLRLAEALTRLPEDYRTVILLRHLEQLRFDEVAARLGRSRPAAQMLWLRALQKLHEELGDD